MKKTITIITIPLILIICSCLIYFSIYYHAEDITSEYLKDNDIVTVKKIKDGYFFDGPGEENALIFYPGAKVEEKSYARLMFKLAETGIDTFLIDMPLNFAFLGSNKADSIINNYDYKYG